MTGSKTRAASRSAAGDGSATAIRNPDGRTNLVLLVLAVAFAGMIAFSFFGRAADGEPAATASIENGVQKITMTASPQFSPSRIELQAGLPTEISVGQGGGCTAALMIPALGVQQDLTRGGAVVRLPALSPGEYPFTCQMGHEGGKLVVR